MISKIFWSSYTVVGLVMISLGLCIGLIVNDFPFIELERKIKPYELLNLFLTFGIAVSIPFIVKKSIDDKRAIKSLLTDEVKDLLKNVKEINEIIRDCYNSREINDVDKQNLIKKGNLFEVELNSLRDQLELSFKIQSKPLSLELKNVYYEYDRYVTGEELMETSELNGDFYHDYKISYTALIVQLKKAIHKIHYY